MSRDLVDFDPVGFEPLDAAWWPANANALTRPWPEESVWFDLRWWRGQERATAGARRQARMPGRPALAQRWGWTDWQVKKVLRDEAAWRDEWTQRAASEPPADRQPTASAPPADDTENAANINESASAPPARRQRAATKTPRASPSTPDHRSPITDPSLLAHASPPSEDPPKRSRKPRTRKQADVEKAPAHPYHQFVFDGWAKVYREECHEEYGGGDKVKLSGHEVRMLTTLRDQYTGRERTADNDARMQRLGRAFRRYVRAALDGTAFPPGAPTVGRFNHDPAGWLAEGAGPPQGTGPPRNGHRLSADEIHAGALALLAAERDEPAPAPARAGAIDTTWRPS